MKFACYMFFIETHSYLFTSMKYIFREILKYIKNVEILTKYVNVGKVMKSIP